MNTEYTEQVEMDWDAISNANIGLGERMLQAGLSVTYDEDGDTLLVTIGIGKSFEAITEELIDNIYIRILPDSLVIVGFVVLNFATDFLANNKLARKALGSWFQELRSKGGVVNVEGNKAKMVESWLEAAMSR